MNRSPSPLPWLMCLATSACLLTPWQRAAAEDPYRVETHGPRIGTRIILFFRDLAYGENPNDRYQNLPSRRQPAPPQNSYGYRPSGQRFNLDQPPVNSLPPQQPRRSPVPPQVAAQNSQPRDMPYTSASEPRSSASSHEVGNQLASVGAPEKKPAPSTPKPAPAPVQKSSASSGAFDPEPKPMVTIKKSEPEPAAKETQIASNTPTTSKRSWENFAGETPSSSSSSTQPPAETKVVPSKPATESATLTGSKTTKDGRVKSPYPPYNELDVTGLRSGTLAMDPTTGKVFRVP